MIRVVLPYHLQVLARTAEVVELDVAPPPTLASVLDALETACPALRGTLRTPGGAARRPLVRFYACRRDLSNEPPDTVLPEEVASGREPLIILGAVAGG